MVTSDATESELLIPNKAKVDVKHDYSGDLRFIEM
jgi:hypothetical protein